MFSRKFLEKLHFKDPRHDELIEEFITVQIQEEKKMSALKALVTQTVRFHSAKDGALWYETADGQFRFPVPFPEVEGAVFLPEDKGMFFMRWIRRELEKQASVA